MKGVKNGVSLNVYEGKRQEKKLVKGREEKRGKKEGGGEKIKEKKRKRDSPNSSGSGLSHFEGGFPKVLRE